jgi:hypothetical protein
MVEASLLFLSAQCFAHRQPATNMWPAAPSHLSQDVKPDIAIVRNTVREPSHCMQDWPSQVDVSKANLTTDFSFEFMWRDAFAKASKGGQQITFGMYFSDGHPQPLAHLQAGPRAISKHFESQVNAEVGNIKKEHALSMQGNIVVQDDLSKVAAAARSRKRHRHSLPAGSPGELMSALPVSAAS